MIINTFKFDLFFGHRIDFLLKEFTQNALIQEATPFQIVDLREIAYTLDLPLEEVKNIKLKLSSDFLTKIEYHT